MKISVRPRTKTVAALLAAASVAVAPVVPIAGDHELPTVSAAEVRPASLVTDALLNVGSAVVAGTDGIIISAELIASLPFTPLFAAVSALQDPAEIASVLSYVAQLYLNPSDLAFPGGYYSYPADFRFYVLESLAELLPAPLDSATYDAINGVADAIGSLFSGLPDPTAGLSLMLSNQYLTVGGRALTAAQLGIVAPVKAIANVINYLGYLPYDLEASLESALQDPTEVPGLLSYLVNEAAFTLDDVAFNFVEPLTYLPPPIGESQGDAGFAYNTYAALSDGLFDFLDSVLPAPITPTPFSSSQVAPAAVAPPVIAADDDDVEVAEKSVELVRDTAKPAGELADENPGQTTELAADGNAGAPAAVVAAADEPAAEAKQPKSKLTPKLLRERLRSVISGPRNAKSDRGAGRNDSPGTPAGGSDTDGPADATGDPTGGQDRPSADAGSAGAGPSQDAA